ncbi:DUF3465 domain-containing protein [Blastopirellula marina]|uniref:DUF3465 domain-containing protein n=1 Tax=Blastopirellula marina DSM 3645 TaxID=314230 RepID=A3ZU92_9BACT|nr:DUF3465 domain-containing protein [Blastopirellula marina]EAQ79794.1 hypothetical protein DSM3645_21679 [Blastopirellula marina DSM 3645]
MKKLTLAAVVAAAICFGLGRIGLFGDLAGTLTGQSQVMPEGTTDVLGTAFARQISGIQVTGEGVVTKLLADDLEGSRHQRFILKLSTGQTLLVAHNMDLAPRLNLLEVGDTVAFNGVYEWNSQGGVLHWTHHDPSGRHQAGWLQHNGLIFE